MNDQMKNFFKDQNKLSKILFVGILVLTVFFMSDLTALATQDSGYGYGYDSTLTYGYGYGYWSEVTPTVAITYNSCSSSCTTTGGSTVRITATFGSAPSGTPDIQLVEGVTTTLNYAAMTASTATAFYYDYTSTAVTSDTTGTVSIRTISGEGSTPTPSNNTITVQAATSDDSGGGGGGGGGQTPAATVTPVATDTTTTTVDGEVVAVPLTATEVADVVPAQGSKLNVEGESEGLAEYINLTGSVPATDAGWQNVHFIAYGTAASSKMSVRDRKGVIGDYNEIYGRVPSSDQDWQDIALILTSHKPHQRKIETEKQALVDFVKVYKRLPDFSVAADEWAVYYIGYNIRNVVRNLDSERAAIGTFRSVYGYVPSTSHHWSIMRAIGYTGAKR